MSLTALDTRPWAMDDENPCPYEPDTGKRLFWHRWIRVPSKWCGVKLVCERCGVADTKAPKFCEGPR